jgi:hypothetical protein
MTGAANAPKIGDKTAWAPHLREGLGGMLKVAITGKGAMPPRGGVPDLSDTELARAIVFMANQSGGSLKEPPAPAPAAAPAAGTSAAASPAAGAPSAGSPPTSAGMPSAAPVGVGKAAAADARKSADAAKK